MFLGIVSLILNWILALVKIVARVWLGYVGTTILARIWISMIQHFVVLLRLSLLVKICSGKSLLTLWHLDRVLVCLRHAPAFDKSSLISLCVNLNRNLRFNHSTGVAQDLILFVPNEAFTKKHLASILIEFNFAWFNRFKLF